MITKTFQPGELVEFPELWGGFAVFLRGVVVEVTPYRLSIQSITGTSAGHVFEYVVPATACHVLR